MGNKELKEVILQDYHNKLTPLVKIISERNESHNKKANKVNKAISEHRKNIISRLPSLAGDVNPQQARIILQYATSVVSFEYRHNVWPYEYMALSRRVGEHWEKFCSAAWDSPSRKGVQRFRRLHLTVSLGS